ncbi:MAG: cyclic nucleotide-binding domain-containing protein, partial [Anaerolineaceae bacterium]
MNEQTQNLLTLLREVPLFSGLSLEEMERLSEEFVMVELPKGENLYQRGEETDGLFVVSSGQIELLDEYGKPLEVLKRAETLGMEALNYV